MYKCTYLTVAKEYLARFRGRDSERDLAALTASLHDLPKLFLVISRDRFDRSLVCGEGGHASQELKKSRHLPFLRWHNMDWDIISSALTHKVKYNIFQVSVYAETTR